jgi:hypothetical protein
MASQTSSKAGSGCQPTRSQSRLVFAAAFFLPLLLLVYARSWSEDWYSSLHSKLVQQFSDAPSTSPNDTNQFEVMKEKYAVECPKQNFSPHIFSIDPIVIYLEKYLSYAETRYLKELA